MVRVTDNVEHSRFELAEDGHVAFADYHRSGHTLTIPHVEAPHVLRGTGAAGRLMQGMLEIVRARGEKVVPVCPYAVAWMHKHPGFADLLA